MPNTPKNGPYVEGSSQGETRGCASDTNKDLSRRYTESSLRPGGEIYEAIRGNGKLVITTEQDIAITGAHTMALYDSHLNDAGRDPIHVDGDQVVRAGQTFHVTGPNAFIDGGPNNCAFSINGVRIIFRAEGIFIDVPDKTDIPKAEQPEVPYDDRTRIWATDLASSEDPGQPGLNSPSDSAVNDNLSSD